MKTVAKILVGAGVAVTVAAVAVVSHKITKTMMNIALDRELPDKLKNNKKAQKQLLGSEDNVQFRNIVLDSANRLRELPHEIVGQTAKDGEHLVGHWFVSENAKRTIIAMHGWRSSWAEDFGMIHEFSQANHCNVLYVEQRAHDNSGGKYLGFGLLERYDCLAWVNWVNERLGSTLPIYLCGISMGATSVMMSADLDLPDNVRGIIADCGFTSPYDIWMHVAKNNLRISTGVRGKIADDICKRKLQISGRSHSAGASLSKSKIPILFIHGANDKFVPIQMTYENYKACASPKRLLVIPGADHGMSYYIDKARYEDEVIRFWKDYH